MFRNVPHFAVALESYKRTAVHLRLPTRCVYNKNVYYRPWVTILRGWRRLPFDRLAFARSKSFFSCPIYISYEMVLDSVLDFPKLKLKADLDKVIVLADCICYLSFHPIAEIHKMIEWEPTKVNTPNEARFKKSSLCWWLFITSLIY